MYVFIIKTYFQVLHFKYKCSCLGITCLKSINSDSKIKQFFVLSHKKISKSRKKMYLPFGTRKKGF